MRPLMAPIRRMTREQLCALYPGRPSTVTQGRETMTDHDIRAEREFWLLVAGLREPSACAQQVIAGVMPP